VEVTPASGTVRVGATVQLSAVAKDAQGNPIAGKAITWTTSSATLATVSTTGLVTGVGRGTATITAAADGRTGTATVEVADETSLLPAASCRNCLEIAPGGLLLTGPGQEAQLVAYLVDGAGARTKVAATFTSAKPGVVSVSAAGVARGVALGSAQVTAQANGKTSPAILVIVATPVDGAMLVADTLVEGEPVSADTSQQYAIGYRYKVRLRGPQPTVGQMVIGTGGLPIFGRVVGVSALPDGRVDAELAIRPLAEGFPNLQVNEEGRLTGTTPTLAPGDDWTAGPWPGPRLAEEPLKPGQFRLGPFACEAATGIVLSPGMFDLSGTVMDASHDLHWEVSMAQGRLQLLRVGTAITGTLRFAVKVKAAWEGEMKCKKTLYKLRLPVGGFLALLITPEIPLGLGWKLKGKLELANVGFDVSLQGVHRSEAEYLCPADGACGVWWEGPASSEWTPSFKPILPSAGIPRLDLEGSAFGFVELKLVNPLVTRIAEALGSRAEIKFLEMAGGLKQTLSLAKPEDQAQDPTYASNGALSLFFEAAVKVTIELLAILDVRVVDYRPVAEETPLARTPQGFITAPASVRATIPGQSGEIALVQVTLDPVTYLGAYAVDEVLVYSRHGTALTSECTSVPTLLNQQQFECEIVFLEDEVGMQDLYAFVRPKMFGVALPVPFEIASESKVSVEVLPPCGVPTSPARARSLASSGPSPSPGLADDSCGRVIEGDVIVRNDGELAALSDVGEITGDLWIEPAVTSTDLRELGALYRVGAQLRVRGAQTTLSGLRSLGEVGRQVTIETNTIRDLRGLERLTSLSVLYIKSTTLTDLSGLRDLRAVGRLTLEDLPVNSLTALANVEIGLLPVVSGPGLWIDDLNNLTSLAGLKPLAADFPGSVWITGNNVLADLAVLRNTTRIRRDLVVLSNGALQSLSHLSGLGQVDGRLSLHGTSITSLDALSGLTSVGVLVFYPEYRPFVYRLPALTRAGIQSGDRLATCSHSTVVQYEFPLLAEGIFTFAGTVFPATASQCRYDFRAPTFQRGRVIGAAGSGLRDLTLGPLGPEAGSGASSNVDLRGLPHLRTITAPNVDLGGNLILHDNPTLTSVSGISGRVRGRLEVLRNTSLDQCAALAWANGLTVDGGRFVSGNRAC
jgi:hypothetical protein